MINLSINQLLFVWNELVSAYYGVNAYGGNVAEIYAFRLLPCDPLAEHGDKEAQDERMMLAAESLFAIMRKFSEDFRCAVYPERHGPDKPAANILLRDGRVHVKVVRQ